MSPSRIMSNKFFDALLASGIVSKEEFVRRVVIDATVGEAVVLYVERYGDSRLLEVVPALTGVEIRQTDKPAEKEFFIQDPRGYPGEGTHVTDEVLRQAAAGE